MYRICDTHKRADLPPFTKNKNNKTLVRPINIKRITEDQILERKAYWQFCKELKNFYKTLLEISKQ